MSAHSNKTNHSLPIHPSIHPPTHATIHPSTHPAPFVFLSILPVCLSIYLDIGHSISDDLNVTE